MITLDPPYRLTDADTSKRVIGWCTVDDLDHPKVALAVAGVPVPFKLVRRPDVEAVYPDHRVMGIEMVIDFFDVYRRPEARYNSRFFLAEITVQSDAEIRTFEYEVTAAWIRTVLPRSVEAFAAPVPPDHLQIRVTGSAVGGFYYSGVTTGREIATLLERNQIDLGKARSILDFGCGCGRVITAFRDLAPSAKLYGCDIDPEAIGWCRENLGKTCTFATVPPLPPTGYADESFDLIYGISVFTHLPETMQLAWLAELRRILRPGGVLLTTVLSPYSRGWGPYTYDVPADVVKTAGEHGFAFNEGGVATDGLPGFYRLAFHTPAYICEKWSEYLRILRLGSMDLNFVQDSVLCQRRAADESHAPGPSGSRVTQPR
jgi:SAM-dependent methyltransferase